MFILKHFKNHENSKVACRKENDNQNFIENGIVSPKNSKDESFGDLKLFKTRNLGNYLQNEAWENLFQNQRGFEMKDDTWAKRWPCTCHGEDQIPLIPCKVNSATGSHP